MLKNDCADFCSQPELESKSELSESSNSDDIGGTTKKVYECSDVLVRGSRNAMASLLGVLGKSVLCVLNKVENVPAMLVRRIDGSEFIEFSCPADRLAELANCEVVELVSVTEKLGISLLHISPFRPNLCRLPRRVIQEKHREMKEGSKDNSDGGHENLVTNPPLTKLNIVTMLKQLNYMTANELSNLFGISVCDIISLAEREGINLYSVDISDTSVEDFVAYNSDKTALEIAELLMAKPSSIQIIADSLKIELPKVPDITDLNDKAVDLIKTLAFMPFMTMDKVAKILGTSYSKAIQFVTENHLCLNKIIDVKSKYGSTEREFADYLEQYGVDALNKNSVNTDITDIIEDSVSTSDSKCDDFFVVVKNSANGSYQWSDEQLKYILEMKDKKLEEIANMFGVSKATVSRVFSKKLGMKKQCK